MLREACDDAYQKLHSPDVGREERKMCPTAVVDRFTGRQKKGCGILCSDLFLRE